MVSLRMVNGKTGGPRTQSKGKHVWQRPGGVEHDVELARLEEQIPSCCAGAICPPKTLGKEEQTDCVEEPQDGSHDELGMLKPDDSNNRLGEPGKQHRAYEGPGDSTGKGEVIIGVGQFVVDI